MEQNEAFRQAKIKELYLRNCGLSLISPSAFTGLENSLELLDLSGNNISFLPHEVFHRFQFIRTLLLRDNTLKGLKPTETFNGFQFTMNKLDLSGTKNAPVALQELRRFLSARYIDIACNNPDLFSDYEVYGHCLCQG